MNMNYDVRMTHKHKEHDEDCDRCNTRPSDETEYYLLKLEHRFNAFRKEIRRQMADIKTEMQNLSEQVMANAAAVAAAVTLIEQLVAAGATSPVEVKALADKIKESTDTLNAEVAAKAPPTA